MKEIIKTYLEKIDISKTMVLGTVCVSFLFTNYALIMLPIPESNKDAFHIFIGVIDASALTIFGYYFGSSKGETKKTELMSKMVDKQPQQ